MALYTLEQIKETPELISIEIETHLGKNFYIRPLLPDDINTLTIFLESLSELTRQRWQMENYNKTGAKEMCEEIALNDKLCLVLVESKNLDSPIAALLEFSLIFSSFDIERYARYGITLSEEVFIRFGPCVRDDLQREGIFSATMPAIKDITQRFGRSSIILWDGVLADNKPAIAAYKKNGFREVGNFDEPKDALASIDMLLDIKC